MIRTGQNRSTRTATPSYRYLVRQKSDKDWSWIETGPSPSEADD